MARYLFLFLLAGCTEDQLCSERWEWESTGHDYVGIPPGADYCGSNVNG